MSNYESTTTTHIVSSYFHCDKLYVYVKMFVLTEMSINLEIVYI